MWDTERLELGKFIAAVSTGNICMFALMTSRGWSAAIFPDEAGESAVEFLWSAVAWYTTCDIRIERVLTDNGGCYKSSKLLIILICCRQEQKSPAILSTNQW